METLKKWEINLSNVNSFTSSNTPPAQIFAELKEVADILEQWWIEDSFAAVSEH
jgi:hypothetical protein